jgi:glycerophosphoryl diester phosphodiesterase
MKLFSGFWKSASPRRARRLLVMACLLSAPGLAQLVGSEPTQHPRQFIAHRGVHLRSTIAGENSLEAIRYARRAGFATIETDVRLTADGQLVIMHDETLNRTCLTADGAELKQDIPVASVTLAVLKSAYVLKASDRQDRTQIPTLKEYLDECRKQGLLPFIEPKLYDASGAHYRDIIRLADEVLGSGHYIITSNNRANRVIRGLGLKDVRLMGILYQTTFEEIAGLGNTIMAISASQFTEAEFSAHAARSIAAGIPTESHADNYARFAVIDAHAMDYVSTDLLAPDLAPGAKVVVRHNRFDDFRVDGQIKDGGLQLPVRGALRPNQPLPEVPFGGVYLELEMKGECKVRLGNQEFSIKNAGMQRRRYQLMVHQSAPGFELVATAACEIRSLSLTLAAF